MFFSWGSARKQRAFHNTGDQPCPRCGKDEPATVVLAYTVRHVWWLFRWVTGKAYYAICDTCQGQSPLLNSKTFEAKLGKPPIDFMDRRGWAVGLGAVGALIATVAVSEAANTKNDLAYLRAPRVGDIYQINFGGSDDKSCPDCVYGAALVVKADAKGAYIHPSKRIYNKLSGVSDFTGGPTGHDASQYVDETYFIPTAKLVDMRQHGEMYDVIR